MPSPLPGSLFLCFLENFSSLKIQLNSPPFMKPPWTPGMEQGTPSLFPGTVYTHPPSQLPHCAVPVPSNLSEGGRAGAGGGWALPFTAMFVSHGLPTLLSFRVLMGLIIPIWRVIRNPMLDTV